MDELTLTAVNVAANYRGSIPKKAAGPAGAFSGSGAPLASPLLQPLPPHVFKGTATIDGKPAPQHTAITAWIDGVRVPGAEAVLQENPGVAANAPLGPVAEVLKSLGDNLVRVWKFDPATQDWAFYDPRPEFTPFNTLRAVASGEFYWVVLKNGQTATLNGQDRTLVAGWNPVGW